MAEGKKGRFGIVFEIYRTTKGDGFLEGAAYVSCDSVASGASQITTIPNE